MISKGKLKGPERWNIFYKVFGDMIEEREKKRREHWRRNKDLYLVYYWVKRKLGWEGRLGMPKKLGKVKCPICRKDAEGYAFEDYGSKGILHVFRHPQRKYRKYHWKICKEVLRDN